jgi:hypothetical protein
VIAVIGVALAKRPGVQALYRAIGDKALRLG